MHHSDSSSMQMDMHDEMPADHQMKKDSSAEKKEKKELKDMKY
jgi:hypothetical protein